MGQAPRPDLGGELDTADAVRSLRNVGVRHARKIGQLLDNHAADGVVVSFGTLDLRRACARTP